MKEQDNIDLSGASLADVVAKPKRASLALKAIALSLCLLLVWAALAKIDQVNSAPAQFIAAERTQFYQSPDSGVIHAIHV